MENFDFQMMLEKVGNLVSYFRFVIVLNYMKILVLFLRLFEYKEQYFFFWVYVGVCLCVYMLFFKGVRRLI